MRNSSANPENQKLKIGMTKSAITLTPPTVGRPSADLSADDRPIKCQIYAAITFRNTVGQWDFCIFIGR